MESCPPKFWEARKVDCRTPDIPLIPRKNTNNKKVVFEGVEAMPVEEEVGRKEIRVQKLSHQTSSMKATT